MSFVKSMPKALVTLLNVKKKINAKRFSKSAKQSGGAYGNDWIMRTEIFH